MLKGEVDRMYQRTCFRKKNVHATKFGAKRQVYVIIESLIPPLLPCTQGGGAIERSVSHGNRI